MCTWTGLDRSVSSVAWSPALGNLSRKYLRGTLGSCVDIIDNVDRVDRVDNIDSVYLRGTLGSCGMKISAKLTVNLGHHTDSHRISLMSIGVCGHSTLSTFEMFIRSSGKTLSESHNIQSFSKVLPDTLLLRVHLSRWNWDSVLRHFSICTTLYYMLLLRYLVVLCAFFLVSHFLYHLCFMFNIKL